MMQAAAGPFRIVVTGGGTGGHLFPGIAVAEEIMSRFPKSEVLFIGTGRPVDRQALAGRSFRTAAIHCLGLKGKAFGARLRALFQLPASLWESMTILRQFGPQLVFGVGGYVTGPVVAAARLLGIATCIHEQNSVPGLTNRWLGRLVDRVFLSMPGSEAYFPAGKTILTGNPVRRELLVQAAEPQAARDPILLVLGGSQGAHRVNVLVTEALVGCKERLPSGFRVIHQTGAADAEWVGKAYSNNGIQAQVAAFFDDMAALYQQAALVVSRAGATTLAELTVMGLPSLLIPYPFAADDHQEKNAVFLTDGGAARSFREETLTGETLAAAILEVLNDPFLLSKMAASAARLAMPEAAARIVAEGLRLIRGAHV